LIDRIRHDIQDRLDQLVGEADKLRRALVALGTRDGAGTSARPTSPKTAPAKTPARSRSTRTAAGPTRKAALKQPATPTAKAPSAARSAKPASAPTRSPSGATKTAVLGALGKGDAMTAGDVAAATGLGRATVSTTLSKLTKSGEVTKAERGYRLSSASSNGGSAASTPAAAKAAPSESA
jgi:DNA-binding transcriptional ArsR family regulator